MLEKSMISQPQLEKALKVQSEQAYPLKIGIILLQLGYVSKEDLNQCLYEQAEKIFQDMKKVNRDVKTFSSQLKKNFN